MSSKSLKIIIIALSSIVSISLIGFIGFIILININYTNGSLKKELVGTWVSEHSDVLVGTLGTTRYTFNSNNTFEQITIGSILDNRDRSGKFYIKDDILILEYLKIDSETLSKENSFRMEHRIVLKDGYLGIFLTPDTDTALLYRRID